MLQFCMQMQLLIVSSHCTEAAGQWPLQRLTARSRTSLAWTHHACRNDAACVLWQKFRSIAPTRSVCREAFEAIGLVQGCQTSSNVEADASRPRLLICAKIYAQVRSFFLWPGLSRNRLHTSPPKSYNGERPASAQKVIHLGPGRSRENSCPKRAPVNP